ncbi:MAG: hypothetical protein HKP30_09860 [Myxococcales bacterium]|nr:hypothetical protein [Myxococcales bacterium]
MPAGSPLDRAPRWRLPAIVALALLCRGVAWQRAEAMMNDGPTFLALARGFAAGEWAGGFAHAFHPLYPLAIAAVKPAFADWETAAAAVSILSGGVAVIALHAFVRSAFGVGTAWVAALLLAVHPYAVPFSGDIQSEGVYMAAFLAALALGWRALRSRRVGDALLAGAGVGLAYLARPEGIGVAAVIGAMVGLGVLRRDWGLRPAAGFAVAFTLGLAIVAGPYLAAVAQEAGGPTLTRKKSASALLQLETQPTGRYESSAETREMEARGLSTEGAPRGHNRQRPGQPSPQGLLAQAAELLETVKHAFRPDQLILVALGLFAAWGRPGPRAIYLGLMTLAYGFVLMALLASAGYVSMRHVLPPMLPLLAYAALGIGVFGRGLMAIPSKLRGRPVPARVGFSLALVLVLLASTIMATRPRREDRAAVRAAAELFASQPLDPERISSAKLRDAYYAGADWKSLPRETGDLRWMRSLRRRDIRYVIVDERHAERYPGLGADGSESARLLHRVEQGGRWAAVYEIQSPPAAATEEGP